MIPQEKVLPHSPDMQEVVLAKNQKEYIPLPVAIVKYSDGTISMISKYKVSLKERFILLFKGNLWLEQLTFGDDLQPQRPTVYEPLTNADDPKLKFGIKQYFENLFKRKFKTV